MQDRVITLRGIQIRCRDTDGAGVPIVLTHGIGGSLELWQAQLDALGQTQRLIAWDVPNHGLSGLTAKAEDWDSYAKWYLDFVDALGLDSFIAAGN